MRRAHDAGHPVPTRMPALVLAALVLAALILAACGGAPPPAAIAPTPSPSPTPTLNPDEVAAAAALAAFGELATRDDLSFHLAQVASASASGSTLMDVSYELDVSDGDFAGTARAGGTTIQLVYVDGITWAKSSGKPWKKSAAMTPDSVADILAPWKYLGPIEDLEFVARDPANPDRLEYRSTSDIPYQTADMERQGMQGTIDSLSLFLAPDGTPIEFRLHAIAAYTSGALAERKVDIQTAVDISRFGEPTTIKPPKK